MKIMKVELTREHTSELSTKKRIPAVLFVTGLHNVRVRILC